METPVSVWEWHNSEEEDTDTDSQLWSETRRSKAHTSDCRVCVCKFSHLSLPHYSDRNKRRACKSETTNWHLMHGICYLIMRTLCFVHERPFNPHPFPFSYMCCPLRMFSRAPPQMCHSSSLRAADIKLVIRYLLLWVFARQQSV